LLIAVIVCSLIVVIVLDYLTLTILGCDEASIPVLNGGITAISIIEVLTHHFKLNIEGLLFLLFSNI
jgi:hypothetical protein